jgi:hypothetical protein
MATACTGDTGHLPFAFCRLSFELLFWDEQIKWQMAKVKWQIWGTLTRQSPSTQSLAPSPWHPPPVSSSWVFP